MRAQERAREMPTPQERDCTSGAGAANLLLEKAEGHLTNMQLNKLIYIAHGFVMVRTNSPLLNKNYYEDVEAWRYGPVIPSIYHEFKAHGKEEIGLYQPSLLVEQDPELGAVVFKPVIKNERIIKILEWIWRQFGHMGASTLVRITHCSGTPWSMTYKDSAVGVAISDALTKGYYTQFSKNLKDQGYYCGDDL
jgi:uncharacterized phage-associated protein